MSTTVTDTENSLETLLTALAVFVEQNFPDGGGPAALVADAFEQYMLQVAEISSQAGEAGFCGLQEICMVVNDHLCELLESQRDIGAREYELLESWPVLVMVYLQVPTDPDAVEPLIAHLQDQCWVSPVPDDQVQLLRDLLTDVPVVDEDSAFEETTEDVESQEGSDTEEKPIEAQASLSPEQQELVDLLLAELSDIIEARPKLFAALDADGKNLQAQGEITEQYSDAAGRIGEAANMVGLKGLHSVGRHIHENLASVSVDVPFSDDLLTVLQEWPSQLSAYLQHINDRQICSELVNFLREPSWPNPLTTEQAEDLSKDLVAAKVSAEDENAAPRQSVAQAEDVSLEIPGDVNPELLESLLRELPDHTQQYSAAIQRVIAHGFLSDLDVAQRIAHTLKGAANVVGVRGIATLTHHLEDILQALSKRNQLPPRGLAETLMSAADCLETMGEVLCGVSDAPADALDVMQEVLDWANRLDRGEIELEKPEVADSPGDRQTDRSELKAVETTGNAEAPTALSMGATLRIRATLADDLLRLAGEKMISTGQIAEHVRRTRERTKVMRSQTRHLQQLGAELEQMVDVKGFWSDLGGGVRESEFDTLELNRFNELHSFTHRLIEAATDAMVISREIENQLTGLTAMTVDQDRLNKENQEAVMSIRVVPVQTVVSRLQRGVRQASRLTGKDVQLQISGSETLMDGDVLNDLVDPLLHLLRNAVDHGIESVQERVAAGKDPIGTIEMTFFRQGNQMVVRCQDDGAGLDYAAIHDKATAQGLIPPNQRFTEEQLNRLILTSGFSTRSTATQVSGRGIGMDAVQVRVQEMMGRLSIQSESGRGMQVELILPVTLLSAHAVLVQVQDQIVAISNRGVEDILYLATEDIQSMGSDLVCRFGDKVYPANYLHGLLRLPGEQSDEQNEKCAHPVLLVKRETGSKTAVLLERVIETQDLVVKPLSRFAPQPKGVIGATILGDGSVAPVLDLADILEATGNRGTAATKERQIKRRNANRLPVALVVDDSLSARLSVKEFVQDIGYQVHTAKDGIEAVSVIEKEGPPDVILVDLEMPRMNGLELTAHIRAQDKTKNIPVIMITSRSTDKHRQEANAVGVSAYLTKPFAEDDLLMQLQSGLRQAS